MRLDLLDAQQALSFLVQQASYIEPQVYRTQYPDLQYKSLIPVDTSANEWAKSVTFFSMDRVGGAAWFSHLATDMRMADVNKSKFEMGIEMAGIGYRYTLEELGFAQMVPGTNLGPERAEAARRAAEEFIDKVAFNGDTGKSWEGLLNNSDVTRVDATADGTGSSRLWTAKTGDQMIRDVNDALTGIYTGSSTVEMADTVLVPHTALITLSTTRLTNTGENALAWLMKYNVYTLQTGQALTIRGVLGLEDAGQGGVGRMVAYRRDPGVLKMHMPMPYRFLPVWQTGPMVFDVPGIFRLGPVEIRRPGAVRYVDGITAAP
jgi:hypothetical protein